MPQLAIGFVVTGDNLRQINPGQLRKVFFTFSMNSANILEPRCYKEQGNSSVPFDEFITPLDFPNGIDLPSMIATFIGSSNSNGELWSKLRDRLRRDGRTERDIEQVIFIPETSQDIMCLDFQIHYNNVMHSEKEAHYDKEEKKEKRLHHEYYQPSPPATS